MTGWREQKRAALGDIHRQFEIPAVYLTHAAGTPVRANVRLHKAQIVEQNQVDDWSNAAAMLVDTNRIVFAETEIPAVLGNAYVIFGNSEAYRTGPSKPKQDGYIRVEVSEVSQADLTALLSSIDTTGDVWKGIVS